MKNEPVNEFEQRFPLKDYNKLMYAFTAEELRMIAGFVNDEMRGDSAKQAISNILAKVCLPRVGVEDSPDNGVSYDYIGGRFVLFVPKNLCAQCKKRKALYEFKGKKYCEDCYNLVKTVDDGKKKK